MSETEKPASSETGPETPQAGAKLSDEAAARLEGGSNRLAPNEWNSGPNLWLVELIARFGHQDKMLEDLQKTVFAGQSFRMHTTGKDGQRQVITLEGAGPDDAIPTPTVTAGETPPVN